MVPPALSEDDLQSYQALFAAGSERRHGIFANLQRSTTTGGAYLISLNGGAAMAGSC
jgi:hypothetical protein